MLARLPPMGRDRAQKKRGHRLATTPANAGLRVKRAKFQPEESEDLSVGRPDGIFCAAMIGLLGLVFLLVAMMMVLLWQKGGRHNCLSWPVA